MTAAEQIHNHQARCQPYILELQMLAHDEAGPGPTVAEVGRATGAIIIEAGAATRAVLAVTGAGSRHPGTRTFLQVRLDRLAAAADEAVAAARDGNSVALRRLLHRFEALTSAIWTVHDAVCGTPAEASGRESQQRSSSQTEALPGQGDEDDEARGRRPLRRS